MPAGCLKRPSLTEEKPITMTSLSRIFGVSAILTALVLPVAGQAEGNHTSHKAHSRAVTKAVPKAATARLVAGAGQPLSALDRMALAHKKRIAADAPRAKALGNQVVKDADEDSGQKAGSSKGVTGGEEYMRQIRAYPYNDVDPSAFGRAIRQRESLPAASIGSAGADAGLVHTNGLPSGAHTNSLFPSAQWSFVGPVNWYPTSQRAYYGLESMNGHLESIAVDPKNRLILYVASQTGGVFKTTNGGVTWKGLSNNWLYLRTNVVAVDPKNSLTVYAGTGSSPTGFGSAIGLMKTTDGGLTWKNIGADVDSSGNPLYFAGMNVTRVLIDPTNSSSITVTIGDTVIDGSRIHSAVSNIWNSTDGGTTWSKKVGAFIAPGGGTYTDYGTWDDAVVTKGGGYLAVGKGPYYGQTAYNDLLYRSTDQGQTWTQVASPPKVPADQTQTNGARLAASPVSPNVVYLEYAYSDHLTLFKSADNGSTWTDLTASSGINTMFPARVYELTQIPYDYYLGCSSRKVSNVATDVLYLGLKSVYQQVQTAGNTTWTDVANAFGELATMHSDQHCIAFDPTNPDRGWFGNDGGIYQFYSSPTAGAATTFLSLNDGLQTTQFYQNSYHPTDPTVMIGGTQDNGTAGAFGDLNAWQMVEGGDGVYTAINPVNPQTMYDGYILGVIYRTDDAFASNKTDISPDLTSAGTGPIAFVTPLVLDPSNPSFLYTAGQKLGRYNAATGVWTYFPTVLTQNQSSTLTVSPADGKRIYVASTSGELSTTPDGGTTWVKLKSGVAGESLPANNVGALLPDPANSKGVYVGLSGVGLTAPNGHLYYCADVTATPPVWTNLSGTTAASALPDAALNSVAIDPVDKNTLYVATDVGVFQSQNAGATWANATAPLGLPNVQVNDLKAMPLQGYLYAGTWGRGIWRIRIRNSDPLSGVLFSPEQVNGGSPITGTVLLGASAASDTTVTLTSSTPAAATVPASVIVPAGQTQASFTVTTFPVGFTTPVTITSSIGSAAGQTKSAKVTVLSGTVLPFFQSFVLDGYGTGFNQGIGSTYNAAATVTLNKAPTTPITISLTSSNLAAGNPNDGAGVTITSVTIPAGQTTGQFFISFNPIPAPEVTTITAQLGSLKKSVAVTRTNP